ncbi:MAG: VIT and VWA domain-containing protein [Bacteroidota bacterium]
MKNLFPFLLFFAFALSFAQDGGSPYLQLSDKDALIPLKETKTDVQISGTIAHVRLTQVYQNLGNTPIEAKYVFPLSTKAAIHKMKMTIGERIINARILEKGEAKRVYDSAVKQGKRAARLDQHRPNVFQMNVGNIMPLDVISIDVYYTELLEPLNGSYRFVAPGVVGPRYTGEGSAEEEVFHTPCTPKGISDTFHFDLKVAINAGMLLQQVGSTSHDIHVQYPNAQTAEITLSDKNENPANRDFILDYSLRGHTIESGLLLYEHGDENFFTYIMEPPKKTKSLDIPSREYLFVVDVSGSMNGYPLKIARTLMRNLLCNLRTTDTFNVQLFASSSTIFSPFPIEAHERNIEAAIRFLSEGQGGGGTQLLDALELAYDLPRKDSNGSRSMVVITDGYVSVEKEAFKLIENNLDQANVFTFGIGSSVNRYLIEGMAKVSQSESFIATTPGEAKKMAQVFKEYISVPLLTQIQMETKGFEVYDVFPKSIPDVFAQRPVVVYGKYKDEPRGNIVIKGYLGKKRFKREFKVSQGQLSPKNKALRYLWARNTIRALDDYHHLFNEATGKKVVQLGLTYNLATAYTSFVAVEEAPVNTSGILKTIKQPLPMPQNVSNSAVGAEAKLSEKLKFKTSFTLVISEDLSKSVKRRISMVFKGMYSKWVDHWLNSFNALRIQWDAQGKIAKIEKLHHGKWTPAPKVMEDFPKNLQEKLKVSGPMVITLTK